MKVAVYCSSKSDLSSQFIESAKMVGEWIGSNNATLVYGGIDLGLMKEVATATKLHKGKVVGIVPVTRKSSYNKQNDENIIVTDLNERKAKMVLLSDVFVVLPGGYGTLDELMSTFTSLSFVSNKTKTIILLNQNGLYDNTLAQLNVMIANGLMDSKLMQYIKVATSGEECCKLLEQCKIAINHRK